MVLERIANPSTLERGFLSSSLSHSAKLSVCNVSQVRRLALEVRGRRFESYHADQMLLGAVMGYGRALQVLCLEGFDSLGLHQVMDS